MNIERWRLTSKRRENLVKVCLSILTADLAGLIIPFFTLSVGGFRASLFAGGLGTAVSLIFFIYILER